MEVVRYIAVFLVVGWGSGLLGGIFFFATLPLLSNVRGTSVRRVAVAIENGLATLGAVYLAYCVSVWLGGYPTYGMFGLAFAAMVLNNFRRIKRAQSLGALLGKETAMPEERAGMLALERMNMVADTIGFASGLALVPAFASI